SKEEKLIKDNDKAVEGSVILLYKDSVVSHSASLRTNNEFKLRVLINRGFTVFLMLFLKVSVSKSLFVLIFI
ncbi:hypothetical protein, partial [Klebsiella pneumoniae]|uniref:hypothetical protein n=1 Tax=Klebsiella pneumoniae TaxID=573 RepID=UPI003A87E70F